MRKLTTLMYFFMAAALFLTSCGGDDEDPEVQAPTLAFTSTSPISGDKTVSGSEDIVFKIDMREGGAKLKTFTIRTASGPAAPTAPSSGEYTITDLDGKTIKVETDGNYGVSSNSVYTITFSGGLGNAGTYTFVFGLTDKDDVSATALEVTLTVAAATEHNVPKLYSQNGTGTDALAVGSFYSTTKNSTYATASAAANLSSLDFALNEPTNGSYKLVRPQGQSTTNTDITSSTSAKTVFNTTDLKISTVTVSDLTSEPTTTTAIEMAITNGETYFFYNSNTGVKGLIEITSIDTTNDVISFKVKYIK